MPVLPSVATSFENQIGWCDRLGSPFTKLLLQHALADLRAAGPVADLLGSWPGNPGADALALRFAAALHALVLSGRDPALTAHYPPAAPGPDFAEVMRAVVVRHDAFIRDWLTSPPQTNEVGRSAVLLPGFLEISRIFARPMRLLEIGASAGLNMGWDRFHYRLGDAAWGDPDSPVHLTPDWTGPTPPLDTLLTVSSRAGCDQRRIDLEDGQERLRLRAYVWADLKDRMARLEAAIALARQAGTRVDQADAADWVEAQLATPEPDTVTVLYHTIVWQYLPEPTKARIHAAMERYAARAPLAWLRLELAPPEGCELTLTTWEKGAAEDRTLADAHPHGAWVRWRA